jgi:hypothetical protein
MGTATLVPSTTKDADVSQALAMSVPSFGNVLQSIGFSIADSQSNLDQGVIATAKQMSDSKIDVISEVILDLDDDGNPAEDQPDPVRQSVSLLNFFPPMVHEWKHVSISMDLTVSALHYQHGLVFNQVIKNKNQVTYPLNWGFLGWFKTDVIAEVTRTTATDYSSQFHQDVDWAEGQVRVDALLGTRETTTFPAPTEVAVGPQIYFNQGPAAEKFDKSSTSPVQRTTSFVVTVLKSSGDVNGNAYLEFSAGSVAASGQNDSATGGEFKGNYTNTKGQVKVNLLRDLRGLASTAPVEATLTLTLGQLKRLVKFWL